MKSTRRIFASVAVTLCLTAAASAQDTVSFALFGDMPYTSSALPDAVERYQRLISHMNTYNLAFGVHVGDIKAGNTLCSDDVYSNNLALFNTFQAPIVFTPGDNEWTDCHRLNNGNHAPLDRLALIRSTFFSQPKTLGLNQKSLKAQPGFPENVRYISDKILVVTVHAPGSNNNRQQQISELVAGVPRNNPYYDGDAEFAARNAANLAWMEEVLSFAAAQSDLKLVVVAFQANPFERFLEPTSASNNNVYLRSGYEDMVSLLRAKTLQLRDAGKAVIAVHGDTHTARVGQRLTDTYPGCASPAPAPCVAVPFGGTPVSNFTRIEVYAQNNVHWIKVNMNKQTGAFTIEPMVVPGNGTPPAIIVQ